MPLDGTPNLFTLTEELNFELSYEDSKLSGHKFGFNMNTGEAISHTRNTFNCVSHPTFFNSVKNVIMDNREPHELLNAKVICTAPMVRLGVSMTRSRKRIQVVSVLKHL
jgi:hypothetical protein